MRREACLREKMRGKEKRITNVEEKKEKKAEKNVDVAKERK